MEVCGGNATQYDNQEFSLFHPKVEIEHSSSCLALLADDMFSYFDTTVLFNLRSEHALFLVNEF
jgi:hypothetical protein